MGVETQSPNGRPKVAAPLPHPDCFSTCRCMPWEKGGHPALVAFTGTPFLNAFQAPSLRRAQLSPPYWEAPQVTTAPDSRMATKAPAVAWMRWASLSRSCTWLLSPPYAAWPQVTTPPELRTAAKAVAVAWMCWTFLRCSCTWLLSPPKSASPQVTTAPDSRMATKALVGCLDVLDLCQLLLHLAAVATTTGTTPGDNFPRFKNGTKSTGSCLDVSNIPQLLLHLAAVSAIK